MYPVMLNVRGQRCLVVGGGGVALRKIEGLLFEGAEVHVVALKPLPAIEQLLQDGKISLDRRAYWPGEAGSYSLVFAATDNRKANQKVFEDASQNGIWVNVADDPELCNFHLPSRLQRGALQLAVASAGEAPFVVRRMRQLLEKRFGPEWAEWIEAAARFRQAVRARQLEGGQQEQAFDRFFQCTVDTEALKARVPSKSEEAEWLRPDATPVCRPAPPEAEPVAEPAVSGLVSLVGAGPGDSGLLTVRGRERLMAADAVVYDNLALAALPTDLPADAELRCVGKQAGHHPVPQQEINNLLLRLAGEGKRVVRLKGGDPYVFGRGGEEAEALAEAGIPFEVIPAVTAGVAVPAYAGIPVTHRSEVVRLTMVTAHETIKTGGPQVRWDLLGKDPHATLIGYMGVKRLPVVVEELLSAGLDPYTPAAMIERGTTPRQRSVRASIGMLPEAAKKAGLRPPGLFIIGPTVEHASILDWFTRRPLFGLRLVMVSPAGELAEALELAGAKVVEVPMSVTPAARVVMGAQPIGACIFKDADEVEALDEERDAPGWSPGVTAWCLTRQAARRAREAGWTKVEELPSRMTPDGLIARLRHRHCPRPAYSRPEIHSS